jgi:hypothetical protein
VRRTLSRAICAALLGGTMLAVAVPAANAALFWDTSSFDFGSRNVGTTSAPHTFGLTAICESSSGSPPFLCTNPPFPGATFGTPTATGAGFAIVPETNSCVAGFLPVPTLGASSACVTQVTFKPTSDGTKTGKLETPAGPAIALKGIGVGTGTTTTTAKKCKKKKRSAVAAKKCKKRK